MKRKDVDPGEFNAHYQNYIKLIDEHVHLMDALVQGKEKTLNFYRKIDQNRLKTAYAEGKWTILEVLLHVIDTERIFSYRALCIARGDKTPLPGFEQDNYVKPSAANERSLDSLLEEYKTVRNSSISLFTHLDENNLKQIGTASNTSLSARAAGFIIAGHEHHHNVIIKERYL